MVDDSVLWLRFQRRKSRRGKIRFSACRLLFIFLSIKGAYTEVIWPKLHRPGPDHHGGQGPREVPWLWLAAPCLSVLNSSPVQAVLGREYNKQSQYLMRAWADLMQGASLTQSVHERISSVSGT
jgi:hypothetical protein